MKAEISHASMMSAPTNIKEEKDVSLGTIDVPMKALDGHALGDTCTLTIKGVYTARHGKMATMHLVEVSPASSKNQASVEEQKMRGKQEVG